MDFWSVGVAFPVFHGVVVEVAVSVERELGNLRQRYGRLTVTIARREIRKWLRESVEGALFLRRIGQDPAVASAVVVTTVTDVFGFLLFLGIASASISLIL